MCVLRTAAAALCGPEAVGVAPAASTRTGRDAALLLLVNHHVDGLEPEVRQPLGGVDDADRDHRDDDANEEVDEPSHGGGAAVVRVCVGLDVGFRHLRAGGRAIAGLQRRQRVGSASALRWLQPAAFRAPARTGLVKSSKSRPSNAAFLAAARCPLLFRFLQLQSRPRSWTFGSTTRTRGAAKPGLFIVIHRDGAGGMGTGRTAGPLLLTNLGGNRTKLACLCPPVAARPTLVEQACEFRQFHRRGIWKHSSRVTPCRALRCDKITQRRGTGLINEGHNRSIELRAECDATTLCCGARRPSLLPASAVA